LTSYHFNKIELEPDLQFCNSVPNFESMLTLVSILDLDHISEPTLIPVSINLEHEQPILKSHIPLMEKECEIQFFDLDPPLKPNLTLELNLT